MLNVQLFQRMLQHLNVRAWLLHSNQYSEQLVAVPDLIWLGLSLVLSLSHTHKCRLFLSILSSPAYEVTLFVSIFSFLSFFECTATAARRIRPTFSFVFHFLFLFCDDEGNYKVISLLLREFSATYIVVFWP
jgi:hypothetical protein